MSAASRQPRWQAVLHPARCTQDTSTSEADLGNAELATHDIIRRKGNKLCRGAAKV